MATTADAISASSSAPRVAWHDAGVWTRSGFACFLEAHGIQRSDLVAAEENGAAQQELRFFRAKRRTATDAQLTDEEVVTRVTQSFQRQQHEQENGKTTGAVCMRVAWVPGFFSLPAATRLAAVDLYQRGEVYGIDISSGFAVTLLDVQPGDHVLDLCCAPGAKLTMIADLLELRGSVTGVDFSRARIGACRQLVHKYKLVQRETDGDHASWRCRLFHADGRSFSVGPTSEWDPQQAEGVFEVVLDSAEICARDAKSQARKRKNKSARAREAKRLKEAAAGDGDREGATAETKAVAVEATTLYDKVLVDAECTHDGSVKHLQKLQTDQAWTDYVTGHLNDAEIQRILTLQGALIRNGFALLRSGGTMIYSTCSLSIKQNEEIVRGFLDATPNAQVLPIDTTGIPCEPGKLAGTVRFTPAHHTSGLFIAKIRKADSDRQRLSPPDRDQ